VTVRKDRRLLGREEGQSLIVVALALPMLLGMAALVLDGANLLVNKRAIQNAADAAALATAQDLKSPGCGDACLAAEAGHYSGRNGGSSSLHKCGSSTDVNCYTWPYKGDAGLVEVRLSKSVPTFFAKAVGIKGTWSVAARAVGSVNHLESTSTTPGTTVTTPGSLLTTTTMVGGIGAVAFTKSTDCKGDPGGASIQWSGAPARIRSLLTNGGIDVSGNAGKSSDHVRLGKYNGPDCRSFYGATSHPNFPDVTGPFAPMEYPVPPPSPAPPPGCKNPGSGSISGNWLSTHPPGMYCRTSGSLNIGINGGSFVGYVFFAPSINVTASDQTFVGLVPPGSTRVTVFDAYSGNFDLNGQNNSITGDIYAPVGNISIAGGSGTTGTYGSGLMESMKLIINGNLALFNGTGPIVGGTLTSVTTTVPGSTVVTPGQTVTTILGTTVSLDE
jgi:Putative Flp pilus-assembly TadE/G-like